MKIMTEHWNKLLILALRNKLLGKHRQSVLAGIPYKHIPLPYQDPLHHQP